MPESYATYTDYLGWAEKRNITVTESETEIDAALYIATHDYIDINYTFKGAVVDENQETSLPTDLVSVNSKVITATCECAYLYLQGKLFNTSLDANGAVKVKMTREKLDVLEEESSIEYFGSSGQTYLRKHTQIDKLLAPYLAGGGGFTLGYAL